MTNKNVKSRDKMKQRRQHEKWQKMNKMNSNKYQEMETSGVRDAKNNQQATGASDIESTCKFEWNTTALFDDIRSTHNNANHHALDFRIQFADGRCLSGLQLFLSLSFSLSLLSLLCINRLTVRCCSRASHCCEKQCVGVTTFLALLCCARIEFSRDTVEATTRKFQDHKWIPHFCF